jgi:hypothetical protein
MSIKVNAGTLDDMSQRFVSASHRLEGGEKVRERHLTFPDLAVMLNALSPKRNAALKCLRLRQTSPVSRVQHDWANFRDGVHLLRGRGFVFGVSQFRGRLPMRRSI